MAIALVISSVVVIDTFLTRRDRTTNDENDSSVEDVQDDPNEPDDGSEDGE